MEKEKTSVIAILMRMMRIEFQYMRMQLEALDLYPGQPQLLLALRRNDGASQGELARQMDVSPATLTVMLRRMDKKQLVQRVADPSDLRVMRLHLTRSGLEKVEEIERMIAGADEEWARLLSPEEIGTVCDILDRVCGAFEDKLKSGTEQEGKRCSG